MSKPLLVVLFVLPLCVLAHLDPIVAEDTYLDKVDAEFPAFTRNLRHSRPALLHHHHQVHQWAVSTEAAELDSEAAELTDEMADISETPPMALPGRHPSVEKALDDMAGDLVNLREKRQAAQHIREELQGSVSDSFYHMNDAMSLKRAIAKKKAQLRSESGKLKTLQKGAGKLHSTYESLVTSLHRMLYPKIMFARVRLQKKEAVLQKEEQASKAWKKKEEQLKVEATERIRQKNAAHQSLLQAEEEVARAKHTARLARIRYEHDLANTAEEVQSYRYAETRFKAEVQHEKLAKTVALAAHGSLEKLEQVEGVEQQKVEQSIAFRKYRLAQKVRKVQAAREKTAQELTELQQQYKQWQEKQRDRTAAVVKKSQATEAASDAYAARQKQVLDSASAKVARAAVGDDDWDGWDSDKAAGADDSD